MKAPGREADGFRVLRRPGSARADSGLAHYSAYTSRVAKVETRTSAEEEAPPLDPEAVERAYRFHRARRAARKRWYREKRWAGVRFWLVLALAVAGAVLLAARTLGEIERIFGL
jgi:hypothetical protein